MRREQADLASSLEIAIAAAYSIEIGGVQAAAMAAELYSYSGVIAPIRAMLAFSKQPAAFAPVLESSAADKTANER